MQEMTFTRAHSPLKQTEIEMPFQISIINSTEGAEDVEARSASLVRARD